MYALHAVLVSNKIPLKEATDISQKFIKNKKKTFYRETKNFYRFKNIDKKHFKKGSFKTKKINKDLKLIYSELLPECEHMDGGGFSDFVKSGFNMVKKAVVGTTKAVGNFFINKPLRLDEYTNTSKENIEKFGDMKIINISVGREPIFESINTALNIASFGKWNATRKRLNFDKLFHLFMIATLENGTKLRIEKLAEISITPKFIIDKSAELMNVPFATQFTLNKMLNDTLNQIGKPAYFEYDAFKKNCQMFVGSLLSSQNIYSPDVKAFVQQDLTELISEMPEYLGKVAVGVTNLGNVANQLTGEGDNANEEQKAIFNLAKHEFYEYVKDQPSNKQTKKHFKTHINNFFKTQKGKQIIKLENAYNKKNKT